MAPRHLSSTVGNFGQNQITGQEGRPGSLSACVLLPQGVLAAVRRDKCSQEEAKGHPVHPGQAGPCRSHPVA